MSPARAERQPRSGRSRRWLAIAATCVVGAVAIVAVVVVRDGGSRLPARVALPQRVIGQVPLPGDGSRFDYASVDPERGLAFIAHLGASEVIEVDLRTHQVVR